MEKAEEILLRLGVDARSLVSGCQRTGAFVRGWGRSLVEEMRGHFGRLLGAGALLFGAERAFENVKEKLFALRRASRETGFSTNFLQSAFRKLGEEGESFDKLLKPLSNLSAVAGERGMSGAQYLDFLWKSWHKLNTEEERNAFLKAQGIKNWQIFIPILEQTRAEFDKMERGNFLTKYTPATIEEATNYMAGIKNLQNAVPVPLANIAGQLMQLIRKHPYLSGLLSAQTTTATGLILGAGKTETSDPASKTREAVEAQAKLNELKERDLELTNQINDAGKSTLEQMANATRRRLGLHEPVNYGISDRMRTALKIDTLEKKARIAFEQGDDAAFGSLRSEAAQLRAAQPWLMAKDRNPMQKVEFELQQLHGTLKNEGINLKAIQH